MTCEPPSLTDAVQTIRRRWSQVPEYAVVLGTGLGHLAEAMHVDVDLSYADVPGFAVSTALAHKGRLLCGRLSGKPVVIFQGRCHLYEGCSFEQLMFPTRVAAALGMRRLLVSNAAGGLNPFYQAGDVMLIDDVVNLMFRPASGGDYKSGLRFTMPRPICDRPLLRKTMSLACRERIPLHAGVYVGVTGPNYETRAEYRVFRRLGGDAVGMSTIPEIIAAASCGVPVIGFSAITNAACPDAPEIVDAHEVVDMATLAAPKIQRLMAAVIEELD